MTVALPAAASPPTAAPRTPPPGPRGHWLRGCWKQFNENPLELYLESMRQYGGVARIRGLPGFYFYLVSDPQAIEHVLAHNHRNYRKPAAFVRAAGLLMGNGLFTSAGDFWLRQRRTMQPAFQRQTLQQMDAPITTAAEAYAARWQKTAGQPLDIVAEMMRLTLRIAGQSLFSQDIDDAGDEIGHAYREAFAFVSFRMNHPLAMPMWLPTAQHRSYRRAKGVLDRLVLALIENRRRDSAPHHDLLERLMSARDETTGAAMTDQQLKDEALTLITAGHETVGATLAWAWYELARNPAIQQQLADEARQVLGGRTPCRADLEQLPFARAVFDETMRLYPAAWGMPREAIADDTLLGYHVPRGAVLVVSQFCTHRNPQIWEQPESFRPERFLPGAPAKHRFAYFPFGGGPRVCIGNHFALIEGPLVLATLAQKCRLALVAGQTVALDPTFTLRPAGPLMMTIAPREVQSP